MTLTDLQEAEKTIGRSRPTKTWEEEREEKEKQDKEKQEEKKDTETKEEDYRSKYRSYEEVTSPLLISPSPRTRCSSPARSPPVSRLPSLAAALQASVSVVLLHLCRFHSQHCLHPVLLQHHPVLQLPEQAQQSDGHHVLLQPLLQGHGKRWVPDCVPAVRQETRPHSHQHRSLALIKGRETREGLASKLGSSPLNKPQKEGDVDAFVPPQPDLPPLL